VRYPSSRSSRAALALASLASLAASSAVACGGGRTTDSSHGAASAGSSVGASAPACPLVRVEADGALVLRVAGAETRVLPFGLEMAPKLPSGFAALVGHLGSPRHPFRCVVRAADATPIRAQIFYFSFEDKSGDAWEDLAFALLENGAARVAEADFPERADYLRRQR